ncbi:hypothetical protein C3L33_09060, partial [Rhododendron williamsianum]
MKYYTVWYGNVSYDVLSATMTKIIKEMLPPDVRVARDAQDLLIECCVGKNLVIASSAALILFLYINDIIRMALSSDLITFQMFLCMVLGFGEYIEEVYAAYEQHKLETMDTLKSGKWTNVAEMTEEEALAEQQRMFAEARARMNGGATIPKQPDPEAAIPNQSEPELSANSQL